MIFFNSFYLTKLQVFYILYDCWILNIDYTKKEKEPLKTISSASFLCSYLSSVSLPTTVVTHLSENITSYSVPNDYYYNLSNVQLLSCDIQYDFSYNPRDDQMFSFDSVLFLPIHNRDSMLFMCCEIERTISVTEYSKIQNVRGVMK